jgi:hypothetical protein
VNLFNALNGKPLGGTVEIVDEDGYTAIFTEEGEPIGIMSPIFLWDEKDLEEVGK